ncbi:MAG: DMT family transporter [Bellilinea sp.]|jgi:drug/metabolite transporter (DMT)-like permease
MISILLALFSAVFGAVANLLARKLARQQIPTRDLFAINFLLMMLFLAPAAPVFWNFTFSQFAMLLLLAAISLDGLANFCYFRSFEQLDATTASSVLAVSPIFALLLAPLFGNLTGRIECHQIFAIILLAAGILAVVNGFSPFREGVRRGRAKEFAFPLAAAFLFSASMYPLKILFDTDAINAYTYYLIRAAMIGLVAGMVLKARFSWLNKGFAFQIAGRLLFVIGQWLALLTALQLDHPAVVKAVADLSPLFVLGFSWGILREKPGKTQIFGVVMIVLGAVLLTLFETL